VDLLAIRVKERFASSGVNQRDLGDLVRLDVAFGDLLHVVARNFRIGNRVRGRPSASQMPGLVRTIGVLSNTGDLVKTTVPLVPAFLR
jgi:hypothetical protein